MNDYIYDPNKSIMTNHNLDVASRKLQKLAVQLTAITNDIKIAADDIDAVNNQLVPSERFEPSTIHGKSYQQWFFSLTSIGNCHDCPLHDGQSATSKDPERLPCGAHKCIVRKLCRGAGLCI